MEGKHSLKVFKRWVGDLVLALTKLIIVKCSGPFQVMSGSGPIIVLPNRFADEIRNEPWLEFSKGIKQVSLSSRDNYAQD